MTHVRSGWSERIGALNIVDLFCGAGGFSLGVHQAGMRVAAAFDIDEALTVSFTRNFPNTSLFLRDVATLTGAELEASVGGSIDGIVGGPPCQGFSDIGKRAPTDPRRGLVTHFFRIVRETRPLFFVMENVRGLAYSDVRHVLDDALTLVAEDYNLLGPTLFDASEFGAATKRNRLFVVGMCARRCLPITLEAVASWRRPPSSVREAIEDLAGARQISSTDEFERWGIVRRGRPSEYARRLRSEDGTFTGHAPTVHTDKVRLRFAEVKQGELDKVGRHPRLAWDGLCPNLRAGTGPDRGSFQSVRPIHPTEDRVITVREAARLQGFPDRHVFHSAIWHSFRMIGNSVSPIMSGAIMNAVKANLDASACGQLPTAE